MGALFEELDRIETPMGTLTLRRRFEPALEVDAFEVKLAEDFLMSSLFTEGEIALAHLGLEAVDGDELDVIVGGLGLGYTARAVLEDPRVKSLTVIEALAPVIDWHVRGLVPVADELTSDPRTSLVEADFFALATSPQGFGTVIPDGRVDAVLVDIDHTPDKLLDGVHGDFYTPDGLTSLHDQLRPGGVFGLWSDDPPDESFCALLSEVFTAVEAQTVEFRNFYTGGRSLCTVYLALTQNR